MIFSRGGHNGSREAEKQKNRKTGATGGVAVGARCTGQSDAAERGRRGERKTMEAESRKPKVKSQKSKAKSQKSKAKS